MGLALAIELGHRGIRCIVVERNDRVGYAPRAKTTNVRTREHFRRWGIAGKLREASPLGVDYPTNVVFCTRLSGHELTRFENAFYCAPGRNPLYAEHSQWIPQYRVEEVMRAHAQSLSSVEIRFSRELRGFTQNDTGVTALVKDLTAGNETEIAADYLVGADGARSLVRDAIGARLEGQYGLSRNYNIVFRAPGLAEKHKLGPAIMYWQVNEDCPSLIGPMDRDDKWFFMPTGVPQDFKVSNAQAASMIARATGIDLPYEILSTDEWVASRFLGTKYRERRVFLAGDACHLHPPFGGYGMNMGIADGVDLGWKLAAVLQGWGGGALLDSYEQERRPVHEMVLNEAVANHAQLGNQLWRPNLDSEGAAGQAVRAEVAAAIQAAKTREFNTLGVVRGYRYTGSDVIAHEGDARADGQKPDYINYVPTSVPGAVAPHMWLHDGTSLYDHFGDGFTLVAQAGARVDEPCAEAKALGISVKVVRDLPAAASALYPHALTLVRPDQHVAWRGDVWPIKGLWQRVTGQRVTTQVATASKVEA